MLLFGLEISYMERMVSLMAKIRLAQEIVPASDGFALVDAENIRGGIHSFKTWEEVKMLKEDFRKIGMLIFIESEETYYKLLPSGEFEVITDIDGAVQEAIKGVVKFEDITAGDNIILDKTDNKLVIGAIVDGDLPANKVFCEEVIDITEELPQVNITTTNNPSLMKNKQDVTDNELTTEDKTIVGAINEVYHGMKEKEREAIATNIGSPASSQNTAYELSNHILACNINAANSLRANGVEITGNPPTYYEIVAAMQKEFGIGGGDGNGGSSSESGKYGRMWSKTVNTITGDWLSYYFQLFGNGYTTTECKNHATANSLPKGEFRIAVPELFDNILITGEMYMGSASYGRYWENNTYSKYVKDFYLFFLKAPARFADSMSDIKDGRYAFLLTTNSDPDYDKLGATYKTVSTLTIKTGYMISYVSQNNQHYVSYELNGSTNFSQYWDSYCKNIYGWNN